MGDLLRMCDYHRRRPDAPPDPAGSAVVIILPIEERQAYGDFQRGPQPQYGYVLSKAEQARITWGIDHAKGYPVFRFPAAPPRPKPDR